MIKSRSTFFIGLSIAVIPYLGFPMWFKTLFFVIIGLTLVVLSIKINFPKKPLKKVRKKEKVTEVYVENMPKENRIESIEENIAFKSEKSVRTRGSKAQSGPLESDTLHIIE